MDTAEAPFISYSSSTSKTSALSFIIPLDGEALLNSAIIPVRFLFSRLCFNDKHSRLKNGIISQACTGTILFNCLTVALLLSTISAKIFFTFMQLIFVMIDKPCHSPNSQLIIDNTLHNS